VAADLVELLTAVADHLAGLGRIAEVGRQLEQAEFGPCSGMATPAPRTRLLIRRALRRCARLSSGRRLSTRRDIQPSSRTSIICDRAIPCGRRTLPSPPLIQVLLALIGDC
jgi:hypothetical protein